MGSPFNDIIIKKKKKKSLPHVSFQNQVLSRCFLGLKTLLDDFVSPNLHRASKCEIILTLDTYLCAPRRFACATRHALLAVVHTLPPKKKTLPIIFSSDQASILSLREKVESRESIAIFSCIT